MCNRQEGRAWAGLWSFCPASSCWSALEKLWPTGMAAGPRLDGRRERGWGGGRCRSWEPLIDRAALLVPRGPSTHTRTAWQGPGRGRVTNTNPGEAEGQGFRAGSLRRKLCIAPGPQEKTRTLVSLFSLGDCSGSVSFGVLLTDPKSQQPWKRAPPSLGETEISLQEGATLP